MIILDTNIISEAIKPMPHAAVQAWLNQQAAGDLFITSITLAELTFGVGVLPEGKRKDLLRQTIEGMLALFQDRILPFDAHAARCYATLAITARTHGKGFPTPDGYIAAIAASRSFLVASRDIAPYEACQLKVINPWNT